MSWASHNPEKYDELVREGILYYIDSRLSHNGFDLPGNWLEGCKAFVETCQTDPQLKSVYCELQRLANVEILNAQQDYFGSISSGG